MQNTHIVNRQSNFVRTASKENQREETGSATYEAIRQVNLPLTDYYANKYGTQAVLNRQASGGRTAQDVTVNIYGASEGENQYMIQAQKQMQARHTELQRSYHMRYQYAAGGSSEYQNSGNQTNEFVKQVSYF